jgi:hypothetical protein
MVLLDRLELAFGRESETRMFAHIDLLDPATVDAGVRAALR